MFRWKLSMKVMGYFFIRDHSELFSQVIQKRSFLEVWHFSSNTYQMKKFFKLIDVYIFVVKFFAKLGSVILNVKKCTQEVTWMKNSGGIRGLFFYQRWQSTLSQFSAKRGHFLQHSFFLKKIYMIFDDFFKSIDVFIFVFKLVGKWGSVILHVETWPLEGISRTNISESRGLFFRHRSQSILSQWY